MGIEARVAAAMIRMHSFTGRASRGELMRNDRERASTHTRNFTPKQFYLSDHLLSSLRSSPSKHFNKCNS